MDALVQSSLGPKFNVTRVESSSPSESVKPGRRKLTPIATNGCNKGREERAYPGSGTAQPGDYRSSSTLTLQAFEHTTSYDEEISRYMRRQLSDGRSIALRYGKDRENGSKATYRSQPPSERRRRVLLCTGGDAHQGPQRIPGLYQHPRRPERLAAGEGAQHGDTAPGRRLLQTRLPRGYTVLLHFVDFALGAAIGVPLNDAEAQSCMVHDLPLDQKKPSLAAAYARARGRWPEQGADVVL